MLEIKKLDHSFGGLRAIAGFDLGVKEGKTYGVIGPNGAGKTTLFNLITGLYNPSGGQIVYNGENIAGLPAHQIARRGVARTFQNLRLFGDLTVRENIQVGQLNVIDKLSLREKFGGNKGHQQELKDKAESLMDLVGIYLRADDKACNLPYGMQRKLEIARAVATGPKLLLLDEPAAGMNPKEVMNLADLIQRAKDEYKLTIVLIEHQLRLVEALCDEVTVMSFGQVISRGKPAEVQNDTVVIKAYLGEGEVG